VRGAENYRTEAGTNVRALKWYDNKPVYLVYSYKGRYPVDTVKHGRETNYKEREPIDKQYPYT
jgi:hypothetical protein